MDRNERVLVTTLTKKMSEDLTDYLLEMGFRVRYLHSEIDTLERIQIIRELRLGEYDVLVGVNLLREGLDLPEVSLVAILDADKEGFLRGETSLIQTIGRAARNIDGKVIMYADKETEAMRTAIGETDRRRAIQGAYNEEHGITPETIVKGISDISEFLMSDSKVPTKGRRRRATSRSTWRPHEIEQTMRELEEEMLAAAEELRFEYAAKLRDEIRDLRRELDAATAPAGRLASACSLRAPSASPRRREGGVLDALLPLLPARRARGRTTVLSSFAGAPLVAGGAGGGAPGARWRAGRSRRCPADWRERRARFGGGGVLVRRARARSARRGTRRRRDGLIDVVVERRGSAFGSGSHPTTQMCVALMLDAGAVAAARPTSAAASARWRSRRRSSAGRRSWASTACRWRSRWRARTWRATGSTVDVRGGRPRRRRRAARAAAAGQRAAAGARAGRGGADAEVRHVIVSGIVAEEVEAVARGLRRRRLRGRARRWARRTSGSRCG